MRSPSGVVDILIILYQLISSPERVFLDYDKGKNLKSIKLILFPKRKIGKQCKKRQTLKVLLELGDEVLSKQLEKYISTHL